MLINASLYGNAMRGVLTACHAETLVIVRFRSLNYYYACMACIVCTFVLACTHAQSSSVLAAWPVIMPVMHNARIVRTLVFACAHAQLFDAAAFQVIGMQHRRV